MSCTTSGSLARVAEERCSSLPSPRTSAVERSPSRHSMTMDSALQFRILRDLFLRSLFLINHFQKSNLVASAPSSLFRADALTPSSARANVTGVFGMDFARLCASISIERCSRAKRRLRGAPNLVECYHLWDALVPRVFAIGRRAVAHRAVRRLARAFYSAA